MNHSNVATTDKVMLPLRLAPAVYNRMKARIYSKKEAYRGYSINEYLTELILQDLEQFEKEQDR